MNLKPTSSFRRRCPGVPLSAPAKFLFVVVLLLPLFNCVNCIQCHNNGVPGVNTCTENGLWAYCSISLQNGLIYQGCGNSFIRYVECGKLEIYPGNHISHFYCCTQNFCNTEEVFLQLIAPSTASPSPVLVLSSASAVVVTHHTMQSLLLLTRSSTSNILLFPSLSHTTAATVTASQERLNTDTTTIIVMMTGGLTTTTIDPVFTGNSTIITPHYAIPVYISLSASILLITTAAVVVMLLLYKKKKKLKKNEDFNNHNYRLSLPVDNGNDLPADDDLSQLQISASHLKLLNCIGQGEFGLVYMGHYYSCDNTYTCVAVKTLKHGCYEAEQMLAESKQMLKLHHSNVMPLIGVCLDAGPAPYIVLPYMAGGCLQSLLKRRRSELMIDEDASESVIVNVRNQLLSMCFQVAKGMEYIAQKKLVHRDLAARNCMIDSNGTIKVSDFGLSKSLYTKTYVRLNLYSKEVKLPIKWLAIESMQDGVFSEKTDVWSFGVTCWEIFSGGMIPYGGLEPIEIMQLLEKKEKRLLLPSNAACNSEIYNTIMYQCWLTSSSHRPSFSQLVVAIGNILTVSAGYLNLNSLRDTWV